MKKMKFTLGLMLSMLILGASVAYAQGHSGVIVITSSVQGCANYAADITIQGIWEDPDDNGNTGYGTGVAFTTHTFPLTNGIEKEDTVIYQPASGTTTSWRIGGNAALNPTSTFQDYTWSTANNRYEYVGGMNLYYLWQAKNIAKAYNRIEVKTRYVHGNELKPQIKRIITLGKWNTVNTSTAPYFSNFVTRNIQVVDYIVDPVLTIFRPYMDRMDGEGTYIYEDDMIELFRKGNIIYSIEYQISMHDVIDYPDNDHDPIGKEPDETLGRKSVQLNPDAGITTDPNHLGGSGTNREYNVQARNWSFTAFSPTPVKVELEALYESDKYKTIPNPETAYTVEDNKDGSYTITIKQISFNYKINIKSATLTSGDGDGDQTGNIALAKNEVWAASGNLYYQTDAPATLSIYSITGQLVKQLSVSGSASLVLPKGLYIVQLNGKAFKVIN